MRKIMANCQALIKLGRVGENEARQIQFDLTDWLAQYPGLAVSLTAQRPEDTVPYPAMLQVEDATASWVVTSADTAQEGYGQLELIGQVGETVVKSRIWRTVVERSLDKPTGEMPDPYQGYLQQVTKAGQEAAASAETAGNSAERAEAAAERAENVDISVGTVETLPPGEKATVTKDPASEQGKPIFSFGIPQGEPGKDGGMTEEEVSEIVKQEISPATFLDLAILHENGLYLKRSNESITEKLGHRVYQIYPYGDIAVVIYPDSSKQQEIIKDGGHTIEPLEIPVLDDGEYLINCETNPRTVTSGGHATWNFVAISNKNKFLKSTDGLNWEVIPLHEDLERALYDGFSTDQIRWEFSQFAIIHLWSVGQLLNRGMGETFLLYPGSNKWIRCMRPNSVDGDPEENENDGTICVNGATAQAANAVWCFGQRFRNDDRNFQVGIAYRVSATTGKLLTTPMVEFAQSINDMYSADGNIVVCVIDEAVDKIFASQDNGKTFVNVMPNGWTKVSMSAYPSFVKNRPSGELCQATSDEDGYGVIIAPKSTSAKDIVNPWEIKYRTANIGSFTQFARTNIPWTQGKGIIAVFTGSRIDRDRILFINNDVFDIYNWVVSTYTGLSTSGAYNNVVDATDAVKQLLSTTPTAANVSFDDAQANLGAADVQGAIDQLAGKVKAAGGLPAVSGWLKKSLEFSKADTNNITSMPSRDAIKYDDNYLCFDGPLVIVGGHLWPQLLQGVGTPFSDYLALGTVDDNPLKITPGYQSSLLFTFFVHYGTMFGGDNGVYLPVPGRIMYNPGDNKTYLLIAEIVKNYIVQSTPTKYMYLMIESGTIPYSMFKMEEDNQNG